MGLRKERMYFEYQNGEWSANNGRNQSNGNGWFHNYRHFSTSDVDIVEYNKWQFLAFQIIPDYTKRETTVQYIKNNVELDNVVFDGYVTVALQTYGITLTRNMTLGMAIRSPGMHFGALNSHDNIDGSTVQNPFGPDTVNYGEDFYRGWIYSIYFFNHPISDFSTDKMFNTSTCKTCTAYSFCSHTDECFDDCRWNEFLNTSL